MTTNRTRKRGNLEMTRMPANVKRSDSGTRFSLGFTLIELLVVIVVIAILAGLLLPVLARAKARALVVACMNHERQMGIALNLYVSDNHAYPFYFAGQTYASGFRWQDALHLYYPLSWTNHDYHCPAYRGVIAMHPATLGGYPGSYAYNALGTDDATLFANTAIVLGLGFTPSTLAGNQKILYANLISEGQVKVPSEMLAITDARLLKTDQAFPGQWVGEDYTFGEEGGNDFGAQAWQAPPQHGQNFNVLSCDGHVAAVNRLQLFNPTNSWRFWNNDHEPHPETWQP
jgi:prepilin-type N-terminal cleavage/methylation domain-containing protein/prepilin-type processing-associated H-X9-DG protein